MKKLFKLTKFRIALLVILIAIVSIVIFRACSDNAIGRVLVYRIARDPTWYPLNLYGRDVNMTAFTNELLLEIARDQNFRMELLQAGHASLLPGLEGGKIDGILTTLLPVAKYKRQLLFSEPIYLVGPVLLLRMDEDLKGLQGKKGRIIAVKRGGVTVIDSPEDYPNLQIRPYDNMLTALEDMLKNKVDAIVMDAIPAHVHAHGFYQRKIKVATDPLTSDGLRLVSRFDNPGENLIEKFNKGLNKIIEDGTYQKLLDKWGLINTHLQTEKLEVEEGKLQYKG